MPSSPLVLTRTVQFAVSVSFCVKRRVAVRIKLERISQTYRTIGQDDLPDVRVFFFISTNLISATLAPTSRCTSTFRKSSSEAVLFPTNRCQRMCFTGVGGGQVNVNVSLRSVFIGLRPASRSYRNQIQRGTIPTCPPEHHSTHWYVRHQQGFNIQY